MAPPPPDRPSEPPAEEGATAAPPDDPTPSGVLFTLDAEGNLASWSDLARELYGYEAADVTGRGLGVLFARDEDPPPAAGGSMEGSTSISA